MRLDDYNLARCAKCNRLMEKKKDRIFCSRCLSETEKESSTPPQDDLRIVYADTSNLKIATPPSESTSGTSNQAIQYREEQDNTVPAEENLCSRCKSHPKLPRKELCLSCTTELYKNLQTASEEISTAKQHNPYEDVVLLQKTLSSARKLEPFRRIRTEGLLWIKRPK
ncbi:MAG: hypothetical protein N3G21_07665 [Candidatus Hydrogenedentes bacterium]|nr:hypothetical protein [Candidatus Hydrogenedentota bacterium]